MKRKTKKWLKKHLNLYNMGIIVAVLMIIISLIVIFRSNIAAGFSAIGSTIKDMTYHPEERDFNGVKVVASKKREDQEITEDEARDMAITQFERLGENVNKDDIRIVKLKRNDNMYYFISSKENTMEISIQGGIVTRINAVVVPE